MTIPAFAPRVLESSSTTGTGSFTLTGAVTGDQAFASGVANGAVVDYFAADSTGAWEEGQGTLSSSNTVLSRAIIYGSSNSGSAVSWTAGQNLRVGLTISSNYAKNCINNNGTNLTANGVLYGDGNAVAASTAAGTTGTVLIGTTSSAPSWSSSLSLGGTIGASNFSGSSSGTNTGDQTSVSGNAGTATALQTSRALWGQSFDGTGNVIGDLADVGDIVGGAGDMTIQSGIGWNSSLIFKTLGGSGGPVTALTLGTDQSATFANTVNATTFVGALTGNASTATALATSRTLWGQSFNGTGNVTGSLTSVGDITGGASSMTILAGTGASRTLTFQTTTSGSSATTALTLAADQSATFAGLVFVHKAADPYIQLSEGGSAASYLRITHVSSNNASINLQADSGISPLFDLNANPADGTSVAGFRLFRSSTTTGAASFQIFKADGTSTLNAQLGGNTATYFALNNSSVGIGVSPSATALFHIQANTARSYSAWGVAGAQFRSVGSTYTDSSTASSATVAAAVFNSFGIPVLGTTNTSITYSDVATVYIAGVPTNAGGNTPTLTRVWSLWIDAGDTRLDGNLAVGATSFGSSAASVLAIGNGAEPGSSPADQIQLYSVDLSAGNATLGLRTETAVVTESVTSDRTLSVRINGTTYKICLKA